MQLMSYRLQTLLKMNIANCLADHLYKLGIEAGQESILEGLHK